MNLATTGLDLMSSIQIPGAHWSRKSQGNLIFLQGQGKVREFCEMVREILNTKKVREKSGKFLILAQNLLGSGRYFIHFEWLKAWYFFWSLRIATN